MEKGMETNVTAGHGRYETDPMALLVNLNFGDGETEHILYRVPRDMVQEAAGAIRKAFDAWKSSRADDATVEDFIGEEFYASGIDAVCLSYDVVDLDLL